MKRLLTQCPRHGYAGEYHGVAIRKSELKNGQGQEVVNCNVCAFANSRGVCRGLNAR
jgi:hypothetical protein